MKTCGRCNEPKILGKNGKCLGCNRLNARNNYLKNKEQHLEKKKRRNAEVDEFINVLKSNPCTDCRRIYPPYVMDFDHLGDKVAGICSMRRRRMSFRKIEEEIAKCELVCANCHRIRTNSRNPARYETRSFHLQPAILSDQAHATS